MNRFSVTAVLIGSLFAIGGADGSEQARQARQARPAEPGAQVRADTSVVPTRAARLRGLPPQLDFQATTLEGRPFTGANLAERPVVFWFWAPSCAACLAQGPDVARSAQRYGDRVAFVGIGGLDGSADRLRQFVQRSGTGGITQLDDRSGRLYERFQVTAPGTFLFL
ncbi:MAG: TlpA family protein disulfide reductase, partial [Actinomadura sp.]